MTNFYESQKSAGKPASLVAVTLHLFFLRIMKEHSVFMEAGFSRKDQNLIAQAEDFKKGFDSLLMQAVSLGNGIISSAAMHSGQFVTPYTEQSEKITTQFTGIMIDPDITARQKAITPGDGKAVPSDTESKIKTLNRDAVQITRRLSDFKKKALMDEVKCRIYTTNFSIELHHMYEEAEHYIKMLEAIEKGDNIMQLMDLNNQMAFWNDKMADHSKATAGKLDPTEESLIEENRKFGKEFDMLNTRSKIAQIHLEPVHIVRDKSLSTAKKLQNSQMASMKGSLDCTIQSIILPLRVDHHIRETAHFMYLLEMSRKARF